MIGALKELSIIIIIWGGDEMGVAYNMKSRGRAMTIFGIIWGGGEA